jgi:hypothetical protein
MLICNLRHDSQFAGANDKNMPYALLLLKQNFMRLNFKEPTNTLITNKCTKRVYHQL